MTHNQLNQYSELKFNAAQQKVSQNSRYKKKPVT